MKSIVNMIIAILVVTPQIVGAVCVQGDCINGQGTVVLPDGRKYVGEFREGVRTGRGLMTFPDGTKYIGDWLDDNPHGQGTLSAVGKFEYKGEFVNGVRHGHGTLETVDGRKYVGQWQNDVPHGEGKITYPNKEEFVGQFENGRRNGQGEVTYPDGTKYKGEWKNDLPNGEGVRIFPDGMQYSGEFRNGLMYGSGMVVMPDGSNFKIQWQGDALVQKKEDKETKASYAASGEKEGWYRLDSPEEDRILPGQESQQPAELTTAANQEAALRAQTTEQISSTLPETAPAPSAAVKEPQPEPVKQDAAEAAKPAVADKAAVSPAPPASPKKPAEAGEYASIAQIGIGANIHPEPSMSSEVLRAFPPGYPVVVLERRGKWLLIEDFRERKGWVYDSLLDRYRTVIIKVKKGNLRSGPDIAEDIIAKLDYGTVLSVTETRDDWLQVKDSEGFSGWLHRDVVWP